MVELLNKMLDKVRNSLKAIVKLTIVVLILTTIFCFHYASNLSHMDAQNIIHGTLVAYTILLIVFILAEILNVEMDYTLTILLTYLGFCFLIASGIILIDRGVKEISSMEDYMITAAGSLAILNGILFLVDSILISNRQYEPKTESKRSNGENKQSNGGSKQPKEGNKQPKEGNKQPKEENKQPKEGNKKKSKS